MVTMRSHVITVSPTAIEANLLHLLWPIFMSIFFTIFKGAGAPLYCAHKRLRRNQILCTFRLKKSVSCGLFERIQFVEGPFEFQPLVLSSQ